VTDGPAAGYAPPYALFVRDRVRRMNYSNAEGEATPPPHAQRPPPLPPLSRGGGYSRMRYKRVFESQKKRNQDRRCRLLGGPVSPRFLTSRN